MRQLANPKNEVPCPHRNGTLNRERQTLLIDY